MEPGAQQPRGSFERLRCVGWLARYRTGAKDRVSHPCSLVGNWILQLNEGGFGHKMNELDAVLKKTGLRSADDSAGTIFSQIVNLFRRITNPKSAEVSATITPDGLPVIAPRIEFGDAPSTEELVRDDEALRLLNDVLDEVGYSVWVVLDRLDEAFQGFPQAEIPALRALLRSYLDLSEFDRLTLKLFVRKDLFRRIIEGGFVNLTHVNARKVEIVWDEEDLFDLLCRRLRENAAFVKTLGLSPTLRTRSSAVGGHMGLISGSDLVL